MTETPSQISRREFLKNAGLAAAGAVLPHQDLVEPHPTNNEHEAAKEEWLKRLYQLKKYRSFLEGKGESIAFTSDFVSFGERMLREGAVEVRKHYYSHCDLDFDGESRGKNSIDDLYTVRDGGIAFYNPDLFIDQWDVISSPRGKTVQAAMAAGVLGYLAKCRNLWIKSNNGIEKPHFANMGRYRDYVPIFHEEAMWEALWGSLALYADLGTHPDFAQDHDPFFEGFEGGALTHIKLAGIYSLFPDAKGEGSNRLPKFAWGNSSEWLVTSLAFLYGNVDGTNNFYLQTDAGKNVEYDLYRLRYRPPAEIFFKAATQRGYLSQQVVDNIKDFLERNGYPLEDSSEYKKNSKNKAVKVSLPPPHPILVSKEYKLSEKPQWRI